METPARLLREERGEPQPTTSEARRLQDEAMMLVGEIGNRTVIPLDACTRCTAGDVLDVFTSYVPGMYILYISNVLL